VQVRDHLHQQGDRAAQDRLGRGQPRPRAIPKNAPSPAPGQDGGPDTSDSPIIGQEPVSTIPVDSDLTDDAPPNGLPDEPITEDPSEG
jgi:hypothetical protein